ncbi:MAG: chemotaxis protein CheX [Bacteriovoracia bacterium]
MIDSNFINPFLSATLNVLKVQAEISAEAGKIYRKKAGEEMIGDVSGVIGIVSDTFNGSVSITFPEATFLKIMSAMLGEEYTVLDKDLLDGAGEITNMIFGQAKIKLNDRGYGIKMALPQVISGKNHTLTSLSKGPTVVVPFKSTAGDFFVEVFLSE